MLTINQGSANTVVVTLSEKTTLASPYYLFHLSHDDTEADYYFLAMPTSSAARCEEFTIIETDSPNPLSGEVHLPVPGFFHYTIYEQASSTNLDPANATGIVETGKLKVPGTSPTDVSYNNPDATTTAYIG